MNSSTCEKALSRAHEQISGLQESEAALKVRATSIESATIEREDLYQELLMAVEHKFPNESRHETALKYIKRMEEPSDIAASEDNG